MDRVAKYFSWKGRNPNASSYDYLGEGLCKNPRFLQQAVDRGFFYVFADKEGSQKDDQGRACAEGNHFPAWVQAGPIEMFWGWVRRQLRLKDLKDLRAKRPLLGKTAYKLRVKNLLRSQRAQQMAGRFAKKFRSICQKVVLNGGAAA